MPGQLAQKGSGFVSTKVQGATVTKGTEASHARTITVQLTDARGKNIKERCSVFAYLSDDAHGDSICASAPSSGWAIGTNGLLIPVVANKAAFFTTESDGTFDVVITEATLKSFYMVIRKGDNALIEVGEIAFGG